MKNPTPTPTPTPCKHCTKCLFFEWADGIMPYDACFYDNVEYITNKDKQRNIDCPCFTSKAKGDFEND